MTQRRSHSLIETLASTAVGFGIAIGTQIVVFPMFGMHPDLSANLGITTVFTVVSILRGYCVRRLFNWIGGRA